MPVPKQAQPAPPSRERMRSSSATTVGFPEREYEYPFDM